MKRLIPLIFSILFSALVLTGCPERKELPVPEAKAEANTKLGAEAAVQETQVSPKHAKCEMDSDCTIAFISCCAGVPVHKNHVDHYGKTFDPADCAATSCVRLDTQCENKICSLTVGGK